MPNVLSYYSLTVFISIILLSGSALASVGQKQVEIAQSTTEKQDLNRLFSEGIDLLKQGTLNSQTQAIEKFEQGIKLSQKVGDKSSESYMFRALGQSYSILEEEQKAISNYNQALSILKGFKEDNASLIGAQVRTIAEIGRIYSKFGEKQEALSFFNQALTLYNTSGRLTGIGNILYAIGEVHSQLGEKQKALSFYDKALASYRAEGDRASEKSILDNTYRSFTQLVSLPERSTRNHGLHSPRAKDMVSVLGVPGTIGSKEGHYCTNEDKSPSPSYASYSKKLFTENVGPFELTGLKPFLQAVRSMLATVYKENRTLYSSLGTDGGVCVRGANIQGRIASTYSNHSFGTAIDINFKSSKAECEDQWFKEKGGRCRDNLKDKKGLAGLLELYPYFHKAKFYWGGTYSKNPDPMHFEASEELIQQWKKSGEIPPLSSNGTKSYVKPRK